MESILNYKQMKILFITNLPSPYRVDFFNEFGRLCDLTVCYERRRASDRDEKWLGDCARNFKEIYAEGQPIGNDRSIGFGVLHAIKATSFDKLIISGYASPAVMLAIAYCRLRHIQYYIESDGGFNKKDKFPKVLVKKFLLCGAKGHFTTCEEHIAYLQSLGIKKTDIVKYPFTSLHESDILPAPLSTEDKKKLRSELGITEEKMVLSVGQFIHRKGFEILIEAARFLEPTVGVYIVGGIPTQEYISLRERYKLYNVHFVDFKSKPELKKWYCAADVFVLPTRKDVWGLVINEAMANGLPVITTDKCIAGLELVREDENGYLVEVEDAVSIYEKLAIILADDVRRFNMGKCSLQRIARYTFYDMAQCHIAIMENG